VYTDGSVTKDQSGWGFTVEQADTTIHEDSAACTVSTSSLTMEVDALTRLFSSRGDSQTTHAIILTESVSFLQKNEERNGKPRLECVNGPHLPSKTPVGVQPWTCGGEGK